LESIPKNYFCFYDVGLLRLKERSSTMFISTDATFPQSTGTCPIPQVQAGVPVKFDSFPQVGQIHSLTERGKFLSVVLHVLQVFEDA
jgi:hypothetical protein